ncbi:uncharacterized protein LOC111408329 [Olea europaea var. sylvestris]|uniref:uncharacterized protein LOC111408329 n=1 Tax=Olea europaea var. sylvestris TaxID=158386 RepID=UPI000C1D3D08|nr:uncharacterized protein LOC111408329 [Olea europaea var. sylvestris]
MAFVAVAKKNILITIFFRVVANVLNNVGASSKCCDLLREKFIIEALENGDTHWGSHYNFKVSLISMFGAVIDVLEIIVEDGSSTCDKKSESFNLFELIESFDFAFNLHLMRSVLGISKALRNKDQDIVHAMDKVKVCIKQLQLMRDDGWNSFLQQVVSFCKNHCIDVPNMDAMYRLRNRIGDEWMNDSLVVYVKKDIFLKNDNELILQSYQSTEKNFLEIVLNTSLQEEGVKNIIL